MDQDQITSNKILLLQCCGPFTFHKYNSFSLTFSSSLEVIYSRLLSFQLIPSASSLAGHLSRLFILAFQVLSSPSSSSVARQGRARQGRANHPSDFPTLMYSRPYYLVTVLYLDSKVHCIPHVPYRTALGLE